MLAKLPTSSVREDALSPDVNNTNKVSFIPSLEPFRSSRSHVPLASESNAPPSVSIPVEPSQQSPQLDFRVIAEAQRRYKTRTTRISAALDAWQPTIEAGGEQRTAIECRAPPKTMACPTGTKTQSAANSLSVGSVEAPVVLDPYQQAAMDAADAGKSFFLTGSAGTGKSFVLKKVIDHLRGKGKYVTVTASTGCAAVAIGGNTVHAASGIGLGMEPPERLVRKLHGNRDLQRQLSATDVLVLDEVSMIDAFLFDKIEIMYATARREAQNSKAIKPEWGRKKRRVVKLPDECEEPFGGMQVIVCGDFFQLPPVAASHYKLQKSKEKYFAFEATAWRKAIRKTIMLRSVHRQSDRKFVGLLNELRYGVVSKWTERVFEACHTGPRNDELELKENGDPAPFTKLYSHRHSVDKENYTRLDKIRDCPGVQYVARDVIDRKELGSLTVNAVKALLKQVSALEVAEIKERCRVLCLKNVDKEEGIVNGSVGYVIGFQVVGGGRGSEQLKCSQVDAGGQQRVSLRDKAVRKRFEHVARDGKNGFLKMDGKHPDLIPVVRFDNGVVRVMEAETWDVYGANGQVVGCRHQVPLTLGWALSIHKSQGMSLEHVQTDLVHAFDFGQVYVAISRATSAHGLRLLSFDVNRVKAHWKVLNFYSNAALARESDKGREEENEGAVVVEW